MYKEHSIVINLYAFNILLPYNVLIQICGVSFGQGAASQFGLEKEFEEILILVEICKTKFRKCPAISP